MDNEITEVSAAVHHTVSFIEAPKIIIDTLIDKLGGWIWLPGGGAGIFDVSVFLADVDDEDIVTDYPCELIARFRSAREYGYTYLGIV